MPIEPTTVAGIDGCPGGWAVVRQTGSILPGSILPGSILVIEKATSLESVFADVRRGSLDAVAIDMPIGLLTDRSRSSDTAARKVLGPRRSSVFATPVRSTLEAVDYLDACARSRAASGKALSKQAFHLLPKIAEVDDLIEPSDQTRVVESHPECAFTRLAGEPLPHPKATGEGRVLRRQLLDDAFGEESVAELIAARVVPVTDLLDALVLVLSARHLLAGSEIRLGGELDPTGLVAEIVY